MHAQPSWGLDDELPGLQLHRHVEASKWCVTFNDLQSFGEKIRDWHEKGWIPQSSIHYNINHDDPRIGPSMYQVTEHFIKPITRDAGGMSYALMIHPEGLECDLFVTHAWVEGIYEFLNKVGRAWPRGARHLWCCSLANPQNGDISALLGGHVLQSPFAQALNKASYMIVVPNATQSIYKRLWCVLEADIAMKQQLTVILPSVSLRNVVSSAVKELCPGTIVAGLVWLAFQSEMWYDWQRAFFACLALVSCLTALTVLRRSVDPDRRGAAIMVIACSCGMTVSCVCNILRASLPPVSNPCKASPRALQHFLRWESFKHVFHTGGVSLVGLVLERMLQHLKKRAIEREGELLDFNSVREAECFSKEDATRIWAALHGREKDIDNMVNLLRAAGTFDKGVRADVEANFDPSHGGRLKLFRAMIVCYLWGVYAVANHGSIIPATPFGYLCFHWPRTFQAVTSTVPALIAVCTTFDKHYQRRRAYAFHVFWQGAKILTALYLIAAAEAFYTGSDSPVLRCDTNIKLFYHLNWSYVVVMIFCAARALLGPACGCNLADFARRSHGLALIAVLFLGWAGFVAGICILHRSMVQFDDCIEAGGHFVENTSTCSQQWIQWASAFSVGMVVLASFAGRGIWQSRQATTRQDNANELELVTVAGEVCEPEALQEHKHQMPPCAFQNFSAVRFFRQHFSRIPQVGLTPLQANLRLAVVWTFLVLVLTAAGRLHRMPEYMASMPIVIFEGHSNWVASVAFSPDAKRVLTGSMDQTALLWDASTGKQIRSFEGHSMWVRSVAFSPDGQMVLTGSNDKSALLWNASTGKQIRCFEGHRGSVRSVAFSPDGQFVLTGSHDRKAMLWDVSNGKQIQSFEGHTGAVMSVAFGPDPDRQRVLTGATDQMAVLWDASTGKWIRFFKGHSKRVRSVAFSPDGQLVLTGSEDQTARLWDASTGKKLRSFRHSNWVRSVAFSPDGQRVLTGSNDRSAVLWDASTGKRIRSFEFHSWWITSVAFSPDGQTVLTGSKDQTALLWDASSSGKEMPSLEGHIDWVWSVAFSSDGQRVLTGSMDQTALLWDASTGKQIQIFEGHKDSVKSVAFSPDGEKVLTGSKDQTAVLWDASTGKQIRSFRHSSWAKHGHWVRSVAFSPDGRTVLTGSHDRNAVLWDAFNGKPIRIFRHSNCVTSVAFSPDGQRVLTGSDDHIAVLWDACIGSVAKEIRSFEGHSGSVESVAFSPDGHFVLTGSVDQTAVLWNVSNGKQIQSFEGHSKRVRSVAFSPNGQLVLTGSDDRSAVLWDASTGKQIQSFEGHGEWVTSVAFSPDGKRVLTGSTDRTVRIWRLNGALDQVLGYCSRWEWLRTTR